MKTNFFSQLSRIAPNSTVLFSIALNQENATVSFRLSSDGIQDSALDSIPPFTVSGSVEELDREFLLQIENPVSKTIEVFNNAAAYLKAVEAAAAESKMNKQGKADDKPSKKKEWETLTAKIAEHEAKLEYEQAFALIPDFETFPDKTAEINKMKTELSFKKNQASLFS